MGVFNDIQNALTNELAGISGLPTIYNENVEDTHVRGTSYLRPTNLPAKSELFTLNNESWHPGIYQVDIFTPIKKGTAPALLIADAIAEHFKRLSLTSGSTIVHVQEISISQARRVESWWNCYVEINYFCVA